MNTIVRLLECAAIVLTSTVAIAALGLDAAEAAPAATAVTIATAPGTSALESFAAREVRRYVYVRTDQLLPIAAAETAPSGDAIIIVRKDRAPVGATAAIQAAVKDLGPQQYLLKTTPAGGHKQLWIVGGDDVGTLYGAYRAVEHLGVRFYLHGDVVPDAKIAVRVPELDEVGKPLFDTRGIQPFHDFPEGPDWWNRDDYLAYIAQLPKMRMNFLGLHCYPEGGVGPEPAVWIGRAGDLDSQGRVRFSYPSCWASTARQGPWGYAPTKTSDYCGGAAMLFEIDNFGPDVMRGMIPSPKTPDECNQLFDRVGDMFGDAFAEARTLGVKTCIGTETPLTVPKPMRERLAEQGKDFKDPAVIRELYEGMFRRIAKAYPVDYYWLWTPEGWTWEGNKPEQLAATVSDIQAALAALEAIGKPFTLATCGWVLGPQDDRAALDKVLPKDCPMSCINRQVGHAPDEPGFADIEGRPKWVIPWMENDPNMTAPQPWVGRMRYDAVDARRLGCTGLLGIHWRTKILAGNVAALAAAGWDQSWVPADFDMSPVRAEPKPSVPGPLGGAIARFTAPVSGTDEQPVYQSVRYNTRGYDLTVPNGTYIVTLKFNEPFYTAANKRVFGASLQGKQVIDRLDMFAKAGQNKVIDFRFSDVRVDNGWLRIGFKYRVEYPCIAGIVIEGKTDAGQTLLRKINCGGDKYQDYEADTASRPDMDLRARTMPVEEFYVDFARASFGNLVAEPLGKILAKVDGVNLPEPTTWLNGPGGVKSEPKPWSEIRRLYQFVDELAALRDRVEGPGNLERFDYWLNTYRMMAAMAQAGCVRGQLDRAAAAIKAEKDAAKRKTLAEQVLPVRVELARLWERMISLQVAATDTPGELGTLANLEQHSRMQLQFLTIHDAVLSDALGRPLPKEIEPGKTYAGPARLIVLTVRTSAKKGEQLALRTLAVDREPVRSVSLRWRPMGVGEFATLPAKGVGRSVHTVSLPPVTNDIEYFLTAETASGKQIVWPATAPTLCQTVILAPDNR